MINIFVKLILRFLENEQKNIDLIHEITEKGLKVWIQLFDKQTPVFYFVIR